MSSYGTEFELTDADDDEMYINRCCNENYPLMIFMGGGRYGVEMFREDVERLTTYLASIVDTVPVRPPPAPPSRFFTETVGSAHNGTRMVCFNTLNIGGKRT
jgi:hypothetical protein